MLSTIFAHTGVQVALDDFGTVFASLTHLKQYQIDIFKIDRIFGNNIEQVVGNAAIVDAIVKLGGSFDMEVVAECAETAAQADFLLIEGLSQGRDFILVDHHRPMPFTRLMGHRQTA